MCVCVEGGGEGSCSNTVCWCWWAVVAAVYKSCIILNSAIMIIWLGSTFYSTSENSSVTWLIRREKKKGRKKEIFSSFFCFFSISALQSQSFILSNAEESEIILFGMSLFQGGDNWWPRPKIAAEGRCGTPVWWSPLPGVLRDEPFQLSWLLQVQGKCIFN